MLVYASKDTTAGNGEETSKDLEKERVRQNQVKRP